MARRLFHIILLALFCREEAVGRWPLFRPHPIKEAPGFLPRVITQDRHGWIWIGGEGGLWRFDGQEYYPAALPAGFSASVTALYASKDRLWAGFDNGQVAYLDLSASFLPQPAVPGVAELPQNARFQAWRPSVFIPEVPITGAARENNSSLCCRAERISFRWRRPATAGYWPAASAKDYGYWTPTAPGRFRSMNRGA